MIVAFFIHFPKKTYSQSKVDSIWALADTIKEDTSKIKFILEKGYGFQGKNPGLGIKILEKFVDSDLYNKRKDYSYKAHIYLGELYLFTNKFQKAKENYLTFLDYVKKNNIKYEEGIACFSLTQIPQDYIENTEYLNYAIRASEIFKELKDTVWYIKSECQKNKFLNNFGRSEEAIKNLRPLIPIAKNHPKALMDVYRNLVVSFEKTKQPDSSYYYSKLNNAIVLQYGTVPQKFISTYNLAHIAEVLKKYDDALRFYNKAIEFGQKSTVTYLLPYALLSLGGLKEETGDPHTALKYFKKAEKLIENDEQKNMLYQGRYQAYKKLGDYKNALFNHEKWKILQDSIAQKTLNDKTNELLVRYEAEKKDALLDKISTEKALKEKILKIQQYGLLGLGLVLLALVYLFYNTRKKNQKISEQNRIISQTIKEKDTLLREIHHRVKNNLQIVSSLLNLQTEHIKDENILQAINEGKNRVSSMALIHQHLYQNEKLTSINSKIYFDELLNNLIDSYDIDEDMVIINKNIQELNIDVDTMIPLGLITNEIICNVFKHAWSNLNKQKKISIDFYKSEEGLIIKIKDNGIGVSQEDFINSDSFGNKLILAFMQKLNADIKIDDTQGTETVITIRKYDLVA